MRNIPDYTSLYRTFKRKDAVLLEKPLNTLLNELKIQEEVIAVDTTGFSLTQALKHYLARSGGKHEHIIKGGYAVGIASQFILAAIGGLGPGADTSYLAALRKKAGRYRRQKGWTDV